MPDLTNISQLLGFSFYYLTGILSPNALACHFNLDCFVLRCTSESYLVKPSKKQYRFLSTASSNVQPATATLNLLKKACSRTVE